nr:HIT domain-containing protein [Rossellomorea aquimaris]
MSLLSYEAFLSDTLVAIPKIHIPSLTRIKENEEKIFDELMKTIREVPKRIEQEYGACRVITNLGNYQDSKHLHFHIVSDDKVQ